MSKNKLNIHSFEDLQNAVKNLKKDIHEQEEAFKESPIIKISSALSGKKSVKDLITHNFSSQYRMSDSKLMNTLLLSNKFTRKYFVGYTIAKEMIPFAFHKIKDIFSKEDPTFLDK